MEESQLLQGVTAFVVEDDAYNLAIITAVLRRAGAEIRSERWGLDTPTLLKRALPVDIILMDLNMPTTDGFLIVKQIRAIPEMANIPVMAVTSLNDPAMMNRARAEGFNGYVAKPINSRTFAGYVREVLDGRPVWILAEM